MSSLKSKVIASAAALTIAGGTAAAGTLTASAATPSCGSTCVDLFSRDFGTHKTPAFVLDVKQQGARVGQPIILFRTSNSDPAQDFTYFFTGSVSDLYAAGMVSPALALHYGCNGSVPVAGAQVPCGAAGRDDYAFELEYAPYGADSGLCVGLASTAAQNAKVSLQPCGVSAKSVWIVDQADASNGQVNPALNEYVPLINGSDTNFSHPFVLTYPRNGYPTDLPRPQLAVQNLTGFSQAGNQDPTGVNSNQLYGVDLGVLK